MPSHDVHMMYDTLVFGVPYGTYKHVHEMLDWPVKLFGKSHRKFFHDDATIVYCTMMYGPEIGAVVWLHIMVDRMFTAIKRRKND